MTMPEAAMYKYYRFIFGENDVGFAGQVFYVEAVTEAVSVQEFTYEHFGLCVFALNAAHIIAPRLLTVHICHSAKFAFRHVISRDCFVGTGIPRYLRAMTESGE